MSLVMREGGKRRQKKRAAEHSIPKGLLHGNAAASGQGIELRTGEKGEGGGGKREREASPMSIVSYRVDIFGMGF